MVLPLIAAAAPSLVSSALSFFGGKSANKEAASSAAKQMAFQKESAQNSYQWATADMKKAGINPMLAYQQGGSSALSGANYRPENAGAAGANSAIAASRISAELENLQSQNKQINSQVELNKALQNSAFADASQKVATAKNVNAQTALITSKLPQAETKKWVDETMIGKGSNMLGKILENIGIKTPSSHINLRRR